MVIEFLGSQTLLDFHRAIIELTDDELWSRAANSSDDNASSGDHAGFFFIEDTFYTYGSVDYVTPIQTWLAAGTKSIRRKRAEHLGLPELQEETRNFAERAMAGTQLQDIAMRLGVRYVHVHHGDVECSVFCVDRRLSPQSATPHPLLHDVWTPNYTVPDCEACQSCPATIATSTTCELTLGHAAICEPCARQLGLQEHEREHIELYDVWKSQVDLSVGACNEKRF